MGVLDGQRVNQAITNPAFINKNNDDVMPNKLGFQRPLSGSNIADIQQTANNLYAATGVSESATGTVYNATPSTISNGDNYLTALYKLAEKFHPATGHAHTGAAGDAPPVSASAISSVPLLGYIEKATNLTSVSGGSTVVTTQMSGKTPSSNNTTAGVCVTSPNNKIRILDGNDQEFIDATGNVVYGRLTYSATVWTLTYYSEISGTETAYTFGSIPTMVWYYQELFNPLGSPSNYNLAIRLFEANPTASVLIATSSLYGKVLPASGAPGEIAAAGSAGTQTGVVANSDHTHKGVHSVAAATGSAAYGDLLIAGGESIGVSQLGNTLTVGILGVLARTRLPVMVGCSSIADGLQGAVPAPTAGQQTLFLRADGTWQNAGAGSVTSVGLTVPSFLTVSGSPVTGSGTLAISLSGAAIPASAGGTGVTSVTTSPTASSFAGWDANKNLSANSFIPGFATTATAGSTTTLVVGSAQDQYFTGTLNQTVVLPVVSTLVTPQYFLIVNQSTGVLTVNSSGGNLVASIAANSSATFTCISTSGTTASSWSVITNAVGASMAPTIQKFTTGSGTYTTPTNPAPLYIRVRMVGGGGGGAGSGTTTGTAATAGGNSSFGTSLLTANGGGAATFGGAGGTGGTSSLGTGPIGTSLIGASGGGISALTTNTLSYGGQSGAPTPFGGGGGGGFSGLTSSAGSNAPANTGAGGGGGGCPGQIVTIATNGGGGGAGGFVDAIITSPLSTYSYGIGAAGNGGAAGAGSGFAGGNGGSGYIEVLEVYPVINTVIVSGSPSTPTVQKFTSGTAQTYTTPTNPAPAYIRVRMVGGGGGGSGSGTAAAGNGGAGGNTTFGTSLLAANGGGGGSFGVQAPGGTGGTVSLGTGPIGTAIPGATGSGTWYNTGLALDVNGQPGASSPFGGAGAGGFSAGAGGAAVANTGSGGGGAGTGATAASVGGSGGGAGGYVDAIISAPLGSYLYSIGSAGTFGTAGTNGFAGGAGAAGYIEVTEYYVGNSVGGTPIANQTANTAYLGPASGGATTPGFRTPLGVDGASMVLLATATASSSSTIDFTSIANSTYDSYLIIGNNIVPATNGVNLVLRISVSGTFKSSAGNYSHQQFRWVAGGSGASGSTSDTGINVTSTSDNLANSGANVGMAFTLRFYNAAQTSTYKRCTWETAYYGSDFLSVAGGGAYLVAADAVDGFRFLMNSGNITSGTFKLYGIRGA